MVKLGSRWIDSQSRKFHVVNRIKLEDHWWVFYKLENPRNDEISEFSCYEESFLERFTPYDNS